MYFRDSKITDEDLRQLSSIANLEKLSLNPSISDDGLRHLSVSGLANLQYLCLADTQITGKGLRQLKSLTNLVNLSLSHSLMTDEGVSLLKKALPKCNVAGSGVKQPSG